MLSQSESAGSGGFQHASYTSGPGFFCATTLTEENLSWFSSSNNFVHTSTCSIVVMIRHLPDVNRNTTRFLFVEEGREPAQYVWAFCTRFFLSPSCTYCPTKCQGRSSRSTDSTLSIKLTNHPFFSHQPLLSPMHLILMGSRQMAHSRPILP